MERFRVLDDQELNRSTTGARPCSHGDGEVWESILRSKEKEENRARPNHAISRMARRSRSGFAAAKSSGLCRPWHPQSVADSRLTTQAFDALIGAGLLTAEPLVVDLLIGTVLAQLKQSSIDLPP